MKKVSKLKKKKKPKHKLFFYITFKMAENNLFWSITLSEIKMCFALKQLF